MSEIVEMIGKKFDMMFVKARGPDIIDPSGRKRLAYYCDCDCGTKDILVRGEVLRNKNRFHSCGCHMRELAIKNNTIHGDTHKGHWHRLYRIWTLMKDRCNNPRTPAYKDYGGRGISICDEWTSYLTFKEWALSHGYQDDLSIDRIDFNGNYCPSNCRWIPRSEQAKNRRMNNYYTVDGETHHVSEWARMYHILPSTLHARLHSGWDPERAIKTPVAKRSNNAIV